MSNKNCPSNHWNNGDDICADCGGDLNPPPESVAENDVMNTSNDTRAERAQTALRSYVEAKGEAFESSSSEIADLMADLLHLAASMIEGENTAEETVDRCLRLARMHFDAEHGNPEEEA